MKQYILLLASIATSGYISAAPIHSAVDNNDLEKVKKIVNKNPDAISQPKNGFYPIHIAVEHLKILKLLLNSGADPNAQIQPPHRSAGARPLHLATEKFFDDEHATTAAQYLIQAGAEVNVSFGPDITPLHIGAVEGKDQFIKTLLKHGANPNTQTTSSFKTIPKGATPLHLAAQKGHKDVVELLLKHNADPSTQTKDGKTPLDIAKENGYEEIVQLLQQATNEKKGA